METARLKPWETVEAWDAYADSYAQGESAPGTALFQPAVELMTAWLGTFMPCKDFSLLDVASGPGE